jgi:hypothetical protein
MLAGNRLLSTLPCSLKHERADNGHSAGCERLQACSTGGCVCMVGRGMVEAVSQLVVLGLWPQVAQPLVVWY